MRRSPITTHKAFTLIELLVVIVIIGVLAAIALPVYGRVTLQLNETKTASNVRQMGTAMLLYASDNNNQLPGRVVSNADPAQSAPKWPTLLKPYLQDTRVYSSPIPDVNGKTYKVTDPSMYFNNGANYSSYIYNGFNDMGALNDPTFIPHLNSMEQASNTILLGIPYPQMNQFYMDFSEGAGNNNDVLNRTAFFTNQSVYMFCDGSARSLVYLKSTDMKSQPNNSNLYADWYWLMAKENTSVIQ